MVFLFMDIKIFRRILEERLNFQGLITVIVRKDQWSMTTDLNVHKGLLAVYLPTYSSVHNPLTQKNDIKTITCEVIMHPLT